MANERYKKAFADMGPEYDSDQDLSYAEQRRIQYANNPEAARSAIWENKPISDKFAKTLKTIWYGDKQNKDY